MELKTISQITLIINLLFGILALFLLIRVIFAGSYWMYLLSIVLCWLSSIISLRRIKENAETRSRLKLKKDKVNKK